MYPPDGQAELVVFSPVVDVPVVDAPLPVVGGPDVEDEEKKSARSRNPTSSTLV